MRDLAEAARYLEGLINIERGSKEPTHRLSLEAISHLLACIDHPERRFAVLHIAGSKGKGSTALFAESLLRARRQKVGTFTSPHLVSWTERFRIDGHAVDEALLVSELATLIPHVEEMRRNGGPCTPSFFDVTTALAFAIFARVGVRYAVVEVGLGGRLDSTNVVAPGVTCITSIELEHTDRLGTTLAAIAGEKAGIIKPGVPVVVGELPDEASAVVFRRAREARAPALRFGLDFGVRGLRSDPMGVRAELYHGAFRVAYRSPLLGAHNTHNAALALAATRTLGAESTAEASGRALAETQLPGRIELLSQSPYVVVDSAHTRASLEALRAVLETLPARERDFVLSFSSGKDPRALCASLLVGARNVTVTRADPHRSIPPQELSRAIAGVFPDCEVRVEADPRRALRLAREAISAQDLLCATGSVYLAGLARGVFAGTRQSARVGSSHSVRGEG
ncbi:MAG: hypothetical protein HKP27_04975 [Myxococcales bacterium]|nr:hypothetical protein [Myxococcales bacterium]